jgi:hypothetical protein
MKGWAPSWRGTRGDTQQSCPSDTCNANRKPSRVEIVIPNTFGAGWRSNGDGVWIHATGLSEPLRRLHHGWTGIAAPRFKGIQEGPNVLPSPPSKVEEPRIIIDCSFNKGDRSRKLMQRYSSRWM